MKRQILILLLAQLCCVAVLCAKDYKLIEQLPKKLADAKTQGHKGWDSGVTSAMKEATYDYNNALVAIIKDLVSTYYPKEFLTEEEIDGYLKALYDMHRFKESAANPSGESQGTAASLEVPSVVSGDLENTISDMVEAIATDDPKFDYKGWKKRWQQAQKG
ncbi:MAG TPA: hypothetical protein VJ252_01320 [Chthoniobacterales bacterium]|nr:hypothetical protein [Chthoniobacterales bacterium]